MKDDHYMDDETWQKKGFAGQTKKAESPKLAPIVDSPSHNLASRTESDSECPGPPSPGLRMRLTPGVDGGFTPADRGCNPCKSARLCF
jgi:hypothetical protein